MTHDSLLIDAAALAAACRTGTLRGPEIALACTRRHHLRERDVLAWTHFDPAALNSHHPDDRPLDGVPFGVKDIVDVAGMQTRCGALLAPPPPAMRDSAVVALLRRAGAVPIGKTTTAELAFAHPPATRNPHAPTHTPGGSSSGSAAAVAAGMVPLALGTQTGGSIIRPAAYCGVVGFKASVGAIPKAGVMAICDSFDSLGWFTRTPTDASLVGKVLLAWRDLPMDRPERLRVARLPEAAQGALEPAARQALDHAAADLRKAGAAIVDVECAASLQAIGRYHRQIMTYEMARALAPEVDQDENRLSTALREALIEGARLASADYLTALLAIQEFRRTFADLFKSVDVILTASAPGSAPAGLESTGASTFNRVWSALGWPAIHLPTDYAPDGLPVGVQLVAQWNADETLLGIAVAVHGILDRRH